MFHFGAEILGWKVSNFCNIFDHLLILGYLWPLAFFLSPSEFKNAIAVQTGTKSTQFQLVPSVSNVVGVAQWLRKPHNDNLVQHYRWFLFQNFRAIKECSNDGGVVFYAHNEDDTNWHLGTDFDFLDSKSINLKSAKQTS